MIFPSNNLLDTYRCIELPDCGVLPRKRILSKKRKLVKEDFANKLVWISCLKSSTWLRSIARPPRFGCMHACEGRKEGKKRWWCKLMHVHNSKLKKINRASKLKSDYTIVFVSIKTSKQDLTTLCFNDMFFERKYFFVYSNLLIMFAKIAYGFT